MLQMHGGSEKAKCLSQNVGDQGVFEVIWRYAPDTSRRTHGYLVRWFCSRADQCLVGQQSIDHVIHNY
jgi:hypothetical protein